MIKVKFTMDEEAKKLRLTVNGHAEAEEKGKDIVCASASILTYTLAQNVMSAFGMKQLKSDPVIKLDEGNAEVTCECDDDDGFFLVTHTYLVIETGFLLLSHNFPQYVELTMFGKSEENKD